MFRKYASFILIILIVNLFFGASVFAATPAEKKAKYAEKVKANIIKLGTGENARIEVKLKDGAKLKGYVNQINENSFIVIDDKTKNAIEIPYPNARQIKGKNNLSGKTIASIAGYVLLALMVIGLAKGSP